MDERPTSAAQPAGSARDIDAWLRAGAGGALPCETVIETSISRVYLFPDRALKLKKPLDLGFLDFTTPARRRWATERELAFNRPAAPDLYRRVWALTRAADGRLALEDPADAAPRDTVDWALEMRRFDDTAILSNRLSAIDGSFAEDLGRILARHHLAAAPGVAGGGARGLRFVLDSNAHLLRGAAALLGAGDVERLLGATERAFARDAPLLERRLRAGFVRCCHGDLHLGNILVEGGIPILFDCIEFNDALREIDVLYDVAFLLMDLVARGAPGAANRVMNGWLDEAARGFGADLWEGLAALPLFQALRAAVRAHVTALEGDVERARRYRAAAQAHLAPSQGVLLAIGGLSGSGKSTLARALAPGLGPPPGAVILRTDEIRKRQWARGPKERLPPEAYTRRAGEAVYRSLGETAGACLAAGRSVIADAVFLRDRERRRIETVARQAGVAFHGVWLEAPAETLRSRIAARRDDASDADAAVLDVQLGLDPGPIDWIRRTGATAPGGPEALQRALRLSGRS